MVLQCLVYMASCIVLLFSASEFLTEANVSFELLAIYIYIYAKNVFLYFRIFLRLQGVTNLTYLN